MRRPTADLIDALREAEERARDEANRLRLARYALQGRKPPGRKPIPFNAESSEANLNGLERRARKRRTTVTR